MKHEDMLRILSMVADGRLTADQACSLIDAIEPEAPKTRQPVTLTGVIESAVHNAVVGATEAVRSTTELVKREQRVETRGRRIVVRASGCSLEAKAHDGTETILQTLGLPARLVETDQEIAMDLVGARAQLLVPVESPLNITVSGSKLNLFALEGSLAIYGVGCDVRFEAPANVHLDAHLDASNLELQLPAEADPRVHIDCMVGKVAVPEHWAMDKHHGTWMRQGAATTYVDVRMTAGFMKLTQAAMPEVRKPVSIEDTPFAEAGVEVPVVAVETARVVAIDDVAPTPEPVAAEPAPEVHHGSSSRRHRRSGPPVEAAVLGAGTALAEAPDA